MNRISSLDGFRAISILLVVFSHFRFLDWFPSYLYSFAKQCDVGVNVFFVISGFLITTLLLKEQQKKKDISLKNFFVGRVFRILPVFFFYFLFICIYNCFVDLEISKANFIHAITFTANFEPDRNWFIGHFWTLAVEQQFYLFWPFTLLLFRKKLKLITFVLIAYSCIVRVIVYKFNLDPNVFLHPFFAVSDSILIGAFTAILYQEKPQFFAKKIFNNYTLQVIAVLLIIFFVNASAHGKFALISLPFGNTIIAIAIMYLILSYIDKRTNLVYKFLNAKVMIHIGVLSYSIYIWQQFFFGQDRIFFLGVFPLNIVLIYLVSLASYYLLEKPFINLRKKYTTIKVVTP